MASPSGRARKTKMSTRLIIDCSTGIATRRTMTAEEETIHDAKVLRRQQKGDPIKAKITARAVKLAVLKDTGKTPAERLAAAADLLDGKF